MAEDILKMLAALDRAFKDRPIGPDHRFYYHFHEASGRPRGPDPVRRLNSKLKINPRNSSCQLFTGYRGTGKSSELRRLAALLKDAGFPTLLVEGEKFINLNKPLEVTDLLLSVAAGVAEQVQARTGNDTLKRTLLERMEAFFTRTGVKFKGFDATMGWVKFTADLSREPLFKLSVQEALRGHVTEFVEEFRGFLRDAGDILMSDESRGSPVLIVDDIEKIRASGAEQNFVQRSVEEVFSEFHWALKLPGWHSIWTAPPYLQLLNAAIPGNFDAWIFLPMVRLWQGNQDRTEDEDGMSAMLEFLALRGDVLSLVESGEDALKRIILVSSGHVRDVVRLMGQVVVEVFTRFEDSGSLLPISDQAVDALISEYIQTKQSPVYTSDHPWLTDVARRRKLSVPRADMVHRAAKLLDTSVVLSYMNEHRWFDVHAAVRRQFDEQE